MIDGNQMIWTPSSAVMAMDESDRYGDAVGRRCKRLREAMRYTTGAAFAALLDVSPQRWNNIETGMPLSKDMAFKLVRAVPGLTLDWLYFGRADGLPMELARRLGELGSPGRKSTTS